MNSPIEQPVVFGRAKHLIGVLTAPEASSSLAVVIPNAGFAPHAGPFRLHVQLAKALAEIGLPCLRFDLSGLGDSGSPTNREALSERKMADLTDAIDLVLANTKAHHVLAIGLCSGATDSHRIALLDKRVIGVGMLDSNAYPDRLYKLLEVLSRARNLRRPFERLRRFLAGRRRPARAEQAAVAPIIHKPISAEQFAHEIESTTSRGVPYLFVFTSARPYNHKRQIFSILSKDTRPDLITVRMFRNSDHTFILKQDRDQLIETVVDWAKQRLSKQPEDGPMPPIKRRIRWGFWSANSHE